MVCIFKSKSGIFRRRTCALQGANVTHQVYLQALRAGAPGGTSEKNIAEGRQQAQGKEIQVLTEDNKTDKSQ